MRIVGGKDYYDHGLAYGVDESVVFVRTGSLVCDIDFPVSATGGAPGVAMLERGGGEPPDRKYAWSSRPRSNWSHRGLDFAVDSVHVVFCGTYYSGARVRYIRADDPRKDTDWVRDAGGLASEKMPYRYWESETFWDMNSLGKFLGKHGARVKTERLSGLYPRDGQDPRHQPFSRRRLEGDELSGVLEQRVAVATLTGDDVMKDDRYGPQFQYRDSRHPKDRPAWRVNDSTLAGLDFVKLVDPVQAFQQLSMWVGGVLPRPGNPTVQITDDKIKLAKHGMNEQSFRRAPQKQR